MSCKRLICQDCWKPGIEWAWIPPPPSPRFWMIFPLKKHVWRQLMNCKILICQDRRNRLKCRGAPWPQILSEIWAEIMEARTLLLRDNFHFCASHYPSSGPPDFQTCLWPSYARRGAYSFKSTAKHRQLTQYSSHRGVGVSKSIMEPIRMWFNQPPLIGVR